MREYKCLTKQQFCLNEYKIVPIRDEDKYIIMKWRNEQLYHLRQVDLLDKADQDLYFGNTISNLFDKSFPDQILFSYLENDKCIGYGGLVHINWTDFNAELSFVMDTGKERYAFDLHWGSFLKLIEVVAFQELNFHKIYTYAFNLRPHLYDALEKYEFKREATLIDHCFYNGKYIDVIIHSKINLNC